MKIIGFMSQRVLDKAMAAVRHEEKTSFTCCTEQTDTCMHPVYIGTPANDNLDAQRQRTAMLVAQTQLRKLYVELTNGDAVGDQWADGEYAHKGYLITNEQLERMRELLGIEQ